MAVARRSQAGVPAPVNPILSQVPHMEHAA
jgi:hypothetical protein